MRQASPWQRPFPARIVRGRAQATPRRRAGAGIVPPQRWECSGGRPWRLRGCRERAARSCRLDRPERRRNGRPTRSLARSPHPARARSSEAPSRAGRVQPGGSLAPAEGLATPKALRGRSETPTTACHREQELVAAVAVEIHGRTNVREVLVAAVGGGTHGRTSERGRREQRPIVRIPFLPLSAENHQPASRLAGKTDADLLSPRRRRGHPAQNVESRSRCRPHNRRATSSASNHPSLPARSAR